MGTGQDREFESRLHETLDHLFDFAYLERHPFATRFVPPHTAVPRGQALRRILLDAIEALNPGGAVPRRSPERRAYAILFGLYVEGRTQADVARSLSIGARQLRRDRAAALRTLYALLAAPRTSTQTAQRREGFLECLTKPVLAGFAVSPGPAAWEPASPGYVGHCLSARVDRAPVLPTRRHGCTRRGE